MNILFLGDIFGKPGRMCVGKEIINLVNKYNVDIVIANGENAAGGIGINPNIAHSLLNAGIDVLTSGNHIYKKREIYEYISSEPRLLKPANFPPGTPGSGFYLFSNYKTRGRKVAVTNICGRVFVENLDCPFRIIDEVLKILHQICRQSPLVVLSHLQFGHVYVFQ